MKMPALMLSNNINNFIYKNLDYTTSVFYIFNITKN